MIWRAELQDDTASRTRLADTLLDQIPSLCGNPSLANSSALTEAALGVAEYLDQQNATPHNLTPRHSCALVSRALEATGEATLARRLLLFGSSIVYPASWVVAGRQTVWVFDVGRLLAPRDPGMEMALFERFRLTLNTFADVWDGTSGKGVLGLKGLPDAARFVLGREARVARVRILTTELHRLSAGLLDEQRCRRQWKHTPFVMSLDL
ncbi:MAG: hypothetical protein WCS01_09120 [bacterium]